MNESDFEGTLILEQLARIDAVDEFMSAADAQDLDKAKALMEQAGIDTETIAEALVNLAE